MKIRNLPLVIFSGGALALGLILYYFGRVLWCSCGELTPWSWQVMSQHNSQHLFDFYCPSHIIHGIALYAFLSYLPIAMIARFTLALLIEASWEMLENSSIIIERYRSVTASLGYSGDSIANSVSDLAMCTIGFLIAARMPARFSVALILIFEATTVWMIRDGLFLNILMLAYPIDAVREWQAAGMAG